MKIEYTIDIVRKDLKKTIGFFYGNRKCRSYCGVKRIDDTPLKIESVEQILVKLNELHETYRVNRQFACMIDTSHDINMYEILLFIAKFKKLQEIADLHFTKKEFEEIADYIFSIRKNIFK